LWLVNRASLDGDGLVVEGDRALAAAWSEVRFA
jgi:hypothetical protein